MVILIYTCESSILLFWISLFLSRVSVNHLFHKVKIIWWTATWMQKGRVLSPYSMEAAQSPSVLTLCWADDRSEKWIQSHEDPKCRRAHPCPLSCLESWSRHRFYVCDASCSQRYRARKLDVRSQPVGDVDGLRSPDNEACWPGEVYPSNSDAMGWVPFKRGAPYLAELP